MSLNTISRRLDIEIENEAMFCDDQNLRISVPSLRTLC